MMRLFRPNYTLSSGLIDFRLTCHFYRLLSAAVSYFIKAIWADLVLVLKRHVTPIITSWICQGDFHLNGEHVCPKRAMETRPKHGSQRQSPLVFSRNSMYLTTKPVASNSEVFSFSLSLKMKMSVWPGYLILKNVLFFLPQVKGK